MNVYISKERLAGFDAEGVLRDVRDGFDAFAVALADYRGRRELEDAVSIVQAIVSGDYDEATKRRAREQMMIYRGIFMDAAERLFDTVVATPEMYGYMQVLAGIFAQDSSDPDDRFEDLRDRLSATVIVEQFDRLSSRDKALVLQRLNNRVSADGKPEE